MWFWQLLLKPFVHEKEFLRKPTASEAEELLGLNKNQLRIMTGLLTGHCHLRGHLFKLALVNSPKCDGWKEVGCFWNVMAHKQKPDFVFRRNGWVHLNWQRHQFSRLLADEVCASAVVMLDTPCFEVVWRVLATHPIHQFRLHSPSCVSPCAITFQLNSKWNGLTHSLWPWVFGRKKIQEPGSIFHETKWLWRHFYQQDTALCSRYRAAGCMIIRAAQSIT
jgi:hypothetical protein